MRTDATLPPSAAGALPLLGHIPQLARAPLDFFRRLREQGPVVRIRIGGHQAYMVTRPELVRRLYVTDQHLFDKGGPLIEKVRTYAGNGLATCPAEDHARQRPLMQPAFHPDRIRRYTAIMRDAMAEVTGSWRPGQVVRLDREMHRLTTMVTSRTLIAAEQAETAAVQIARSLPIITQGLYWRMVIPSGLFPRLPLPVNRRFDREQARVREVIDQVVSHYRATGTDHGDLLSMVLAACEREADPARAVYDQVITILTAGVETTAATSVWALRALNRHQKIAALVCAELDEVLAGRSPGHDDLPRLAYTQRVLTETLRLYPPVWLVSRRSTAEVAWRGGRIPAGADVFFSPYALHRDPEVFAEPEVFDPDRWAPERVTTTQRQSFFGFGAGRRKCIGDALGMNEATIAVAAVLSRWRLRHRRDDVGERPALRMLLMPPPTEVRVEPRTTTRTK